MNEIVRQLGDSTVSIDLYIRQNDEAVTGAAATVAIRRLSDDQFLDFNDDTFKASGWTTKNQALTEITGIAELAGLYSFTWDSSLSVMAVGEYSFEFTRTDTTPDWLKAETVRFEKSVLAQKMVVNRLVLNQTLSRLEIYDDDGTTLLATWPVTDRAGNSFILQGTGPANRGAQNP